MKKKLFLIFVLILMLILALAACDMGSTPHAHFYGEWETIEEATCTEDGTKERVCSCGEKQTETITALGHTFGEWVETKAPTCTEDGAKERVCACGEKEVKTLPANETAHNYSTTWTSDDTSHWYVCQNSGCNSVSDQAIHTFSEWVEIKTPTCTEDGTKERVCACGKKESETIPTDVTAHNYSTTWIKDTTNHWHKCQNYGCTSVSAQPHTFGEWVVNKEATCVSTGQRYHICTVCSWRESENIPVDMNAHSYSNDWTTDDEERWHACQNAGCTAKADSTAHTFGEWIVDKAATCTNTGMRHHICTACNKTVSEIIPIDTSAHPHVSSQWTTNSTDHWHKCLVVNCSAPVDKKEHDMVDGTCTVCEYSLVARDGDYLYFGEYPQTVKTPNVTITSEQDKRGYYLGSDGFYYAKLKATPAENSYFPSGEKVQEKETYYFKVEPIRWRIMSQSDGSVTILCDQIIDLQVFDRYEVAGYIYGEIDYGYSSIRDWLNTTFYEVAFGDLQKALINTTRVDMSFKSTCQSDAGLVFEDVFDKVFLISTLEYEHIRCNEEYDMLLKSTTDYALALGVKVKYNELLDRFCGSWWLRSAYMYNYYVQTVNSSYWFPQLGYGSNIFRKGIVPALQIRLH